VVVPQTTQPDGTPIRLLVRPEDLHLSELDAIGGTVTSCTFQGSSTVLGVRLDVLDALVSVHVAGVADLNPGERVQVSIDGARAVCEPLDDVTSSAAGSGATTAAASAPA
jgi:ABC-type Fe3+/spermidine/putrescine transport system ATPase subunit